MSLFNALHLRPRLFPLSPFKVFVKPLPMATTLSRSPSLRSCETCKIVTVEGIIKPLKGFGILQ
jgi:hypothetical protein